jgi:hypothetical protein
MRVFFGLGVCLLVCIACQHPTERIPPNDWLDALIHQYTAEPVTNPPRQIVQYTYQGQTVYYVPPVCCDVLGQLYSATGQLLCAPDGGLQGQGDGRCPDFFQTAQSVKVVWQDQRTQ